MKDLGHWLDLRTNRPVRLRWDPSTGRLIVLHEGKEAEIIGTYPANVVESLELGAAGHVFGFLLKLPEFGCWEV